MNLAVRVYPNVEALIGGAARALVAEIQRALRTRVNFSCVLSGGHTPRPLYQALARDYGDTIPWPRLHLFWSDERYVPQSDPQSNYRMVRESLLDLIAMPPSHVHPMPTDVPTPAEAAGVYEQTLRNHFAMSSPRVDLVLLGMGADGHTASLFPGSPAVEEHSRWVVDVRAPAEQIQRLTLTFPIINTAAVVFFLVTGNEKAESLRRALCEPPDPLSCPASGVRPVDGSVVWWVDEMAAALLPSSMVEVGEGV